MTRLLSDLQQSLRFKLFAATICSLIVVLGSVAWIAYDKGRHEAEELMDGQLALSARLLEGQIQHEDQQHPEEDRTQAPSNGSGAHATNRQIDDAIVVNTPGDSSRQPYEQELAFQIWSDQGVLNLISANARLMPRISASGYHLQEFDGSFWRIYVRQSENGKHWIQVAHPIATRHMIGLDVAERVTLPLLVAIPFLVVMLLVVIGRSLSPLRQIAGKLRLRSAQDLNPVPTRGVPVEILPFINEINSLLRKVAVTLENERRFTSNAAHELRTPLAGIKLHAQLAVQAKDPATRQRFTENVLSGVTRAERLVEQMLRLARLSPEAGVIKSKLESIDVRTLMLEVTDIQQVTAARKSQKIETDISPTAQQIQGDEDLLRVALCNLTENACRYSPESTTITVGSWRDDSAYGLYVADQGPGIAPDELPFITQRFRRGKDVRVEGSGLGLTIVERIAELHGAQLRIRNLVGGGLRTEISWSTDTGAMA